MPFEMTITSVDPSRQSVTISGRLTSGRYFGPEEAELVLNDGRVFRIVIGSFSATTPRDWPILPEHNTVLHLELLGCPPDTIGPGTVLRGLGFPSSSPSGRLLANEWLDAPIFWALH
jgi:hypothetical protein